jgi:acyl-CoA thioesterase I
MIATISPPARESLTLICSGLTRASTSGAARLERSPVGPRVKREDVNNRRRRGYCWIAGALIAFALLLAAPAAAADTVRIVALGDSLTAGYGLDAEDSFPAVLEAELRARGHNVEVVNAGVSGDTTRGGLERLDWAVGDDTDAVIVELGANDALRGIEPGATRDNLDSIVGQLVARDIPVLLAGMQAPPNLGDDYAAAFNAIFPDLAERHGVLLYPFFLEGVAAERQLNQSDGMHPNEAGVREIVARMIEPVEALIAEAAGTGGER